MVLAEGASESVLEFFLYDSVKILVLLWLMVFAIGVVRTYIPQKKIRGWLSGRYGISYVAAAFFGAVTPFCSCSSIPLFIGFIKAGAPLGSAFTFLVASPLINEYLVVLMLGFFGLKVTVAYIVTGLLLAIVSGLVISRLNMERYLVEGMQAQEARENSVGYKELKKRVVFGVHEANDIVSSLWKWVLLGVGVGAVIHGFIPQAVIDGAVAAAGVFAVPIVVAIGVPMYANCAAVLPIAAALFEKGVPLGTALAFMMSTAALSLPEAIILRRVMRIQLILTFFGIVALGIIIIGYLFNMLV
ncbi:putative permease [uncultured archaeon]|nr:putative permease [uncultured archaeon]